MGRFPANVNDMFGLGASNAVLSSGQSLASSGAIKRKIDRMGCCSYSFYYIWAFLCRILKMKVGSMKNFLWLVISFCMITAGGYAQDFRLQPTPQEYVFQNDSVSVPQTYLLHAGSSLEGQPALSVLDKLLPGGESQASFQIYVGTKADKEVRKFRKRIPDVPDGYFLKITKDCIVIAGADKRGVYYGVQTLAQLLTLNSLPAVEITDFPDVPYRGVVEGFYGTPWSHEARMDQLDFYGKNKMNVYIYGPKDDPYHRTPHWRKPYPAQEGERIKQLVERAKQNEVIFYWAIHPGGDIHWNEEDRTNLLRKFESMYQLGVRGFAVFFDDISGEGTQAEKQVELLNYIDKNFVQAKQDVAPLIMCPTVYCGAWGKGSDYLPTLGEGLNEDIRIMWTGDKVCTNITMSTLDYVNPLLQRKAFIWWNYPVSDYVTDHLLLGPVYGNDSNIKDKVSAFVSNPMEYAEASKIALYGVADYTWNMADYDSQASWKYALKALMPFHADYLETFASHNSDQGPSGLEFRREESVSIQSALSKLLESYREEQKKDDSSYWEVVKECRRIIASANVLLASEKENPALYKEIKPWLLQFKLVGEYGGEVLNMMESFQVKERFMRSYEQARALQILMREVNDTYNRTASHPGIKSGSRHLRPTFDALFELATERYNKEHNVYLNTQPLPWEEVKKL